MGDFITSQMSNMFGDFRTNGPYRGWIGLRCDWKSMTGSNGPGMNRMQVLHVQ